MDIFNYSQFGLSDYGIKKENEDFFFCNYPYITGDKGSGISCLSVIADGMGGLHNGKEAAKIAINTFVNHISQQSFDYEDKSESVLNHMEKGFEISNEKVIEMSKVNRLYSGTTLTAALLIKDKLFITHVGDTRAYILNKNFFGRYSSYQITSDHNPLNQPFKLTEFIGNQDKKIEPSKYEISLKPGNLLILTSDGFHDYVSEKIFHKLVRKNEIKKLPKMLIEEAIKQSSKDNITAVITKIER